MLKDSLYRQFARYSGLAFLIPICAVVGYAIGRYLDHAFGTHVLKIIFLLLGIAAGMIELIRELLKNDGQDER